MINFKYGPQTKLHPGWQAYSLLECFLIFPPPNKRWFARLLNIFSVSIINNNQFQDKKFFYKQYEVKSSIKFL